MVHPKTRITKLKKKNEGAVFSPLLALVSSTEVMGHIFQPPLRSTNEAPMGFSAPCFSGGFF